jgi:hypothetical protein
MSRRRVTNVRSNQRRSLHCRGSHGGIVMRARHPNCTLAVCDILEQHLQLLKKQNEISDPGL